MTPLYRLLDAIRQAERLIPETRGLAELMWRYSQGVALSAADLKRLDEIIAALSVKGVFSDLPNDNLRWPRDLFS